MPEFIRTYEEKDMDMYFFSLVLSWIRGTILLQLQGRETGEPQGLGHLLNL
jgi:hypothetical protein